MGLSVKLCGCMVFLEVTGSDNLWVGSFSGTHTVESIHILVIWVTRLLQSIFCFSHCYSSEQLLISKPNPLPDGQWELCHWFLPQLDQITGLLHLHHCYKLLWWKIEIYLGFALFFFIFTFHSFPLWDIYLPYTWGFSKCSEHISVCLHNTFAHTSPLVWELLLHSWLSPRFSAPLVLFLSSSLFVSCKTPWELLIMKGTDFFFLLVKW